MHAYILRTLCTPVRTLCAPVPTSVYECCCLLLLTLFSGFLLRLKRKKESWKPKKRKNHILRTLLRTFVRQSAHECDSWFLLTFQ